MILQFERSYYHCFGSCFSLFELIFRGFVEDRSIPEHKYRLRILLDTRQQPRSLDRGTSPYDPGIRAVSVSVNSARSLP